MRFSKRAIGIICGIGAAICYGTNPLGALKLYAEGMNTPSVLFYRFGLAWLLVSILMLLRHESLRVNRKEFTILSWLGILFTISSFTLYLSFKYMAAGIASTLLFIYPVLTALIMAIFFKEKATLKIIASTILSLLGVVLLYWNSDGSTLNLMGVLLVFISSLSYAIYIIIINKSPLEISSFKINFYVLLYCTIGMTVLSLIMREPLQWPANATSWFYAGWLAIVPAFLSLVLMVYASKYVGATPTAILGALEPLTAVLIGLYVFGEPFTTHLAIGIILILSAVIIIALNKRSVQSK